MVINADGSFYQFYASPTRHQPICNSGRWDVSPSDPGHIGLTDLIRWDEDEDGTGKNVADRKFTSFRAPLEIKKRSVEITLNDDLGRRFKKLQ